MKKSILKIIITVFFFIPLILIADQVIDDGNGRVGGGGGGGGGQPTCSFPYVLNSSKTACIVQFDNSSNIFVSTKEADDITYTTARLNGTGGNIKGSNNTGTWRSTSSDGRSGVWSSAEGSGTWVEVGYAGGGPAGVMTAYWVGTKGDGTGTWNNGGLASGTWTNGKGTGGIGSGTWINPESYGLKDQSSSMTAYFRYSKAAISPIFCNDIYGRNMTATKDIPLGMSGEANFYQNVTGLTPDTTYYYCAIISDKNQIAYGGKEIVKSFHTSPYKTTIETINATNIKADSAVLNGYFSSIQDVNTYFQYKKINADGTSNGWINTKKVIHKLGTNSSGSKNSNVYGEFKVPPDSGADRKIFEIDPLVPGTKYAFRAVAETNSGKEIKTIYGSTLYFITSLSRTGDDSGVEKICSNGANNYPTCNNFPNLPSVIVTANPTSIKPGESSIISWTANNVTACNDGHNNTEKNKGSFNTGPLTSSKAFYVTCNTSRGTVNGYSYVYVGDGTGSDNTNLPSVTVTASPTSIKPGESSTVSWTARNVISCDDGHNNQQKNQGSFNTGALNIGKSFLVSCVAQNGNLNGSVFVNVDTSGGETGTWTRGNDWGTWSTTSGTMGNREGVIWTGTGNGSGTWRSPSGSGTWSGTGNGTGTWDTITTNTNSSGIINTAPHNLGDKVNPPEIDIVRYHEGIETVFTRQIMADMAFAKMYGYVEGNDLQTFAWDLADQLARMFGYVSESGKEIRVSYPDVAAYQLQQIGNKLTVYEYYKNKIVDIRDAQAVLKDASGYEYYFKK